MTRGFHLATVLVLAALVLVAGGCKSTASGGRPAARNTEAPRCCAGGVDLSQARAGYMQLVRRAVERPAPGALVAAAWQGLLDEARRQGVATDGAQAPAAGADAASAFDALNDTFNHLVLERRGPLDVTQLNYAALDQMTKSLADTHTVFLPPSIFSRQMQREAGNLGTSVGISLEQVSANPPIVVEVVPGSAADEAGVRPGDTVVAINGRSIDTYSAREASHTIEGDDGTRLVLDVRRAGSARIRRITIMRRTIALDLVSHTELPGNVGYVRIREFSENVPIHLQVEQALGDFRFDHTNGVIVDLRNNPGGALQELSVVLGDFVSQSPLAYGIGRDGVLQPLDRLGPFKFDQRFVVLVNGGSASSSEMFGAAVQEYHDGLLIGTRTCGCLMGAILVGLPPDNKAGMEIAIERVLTPVRQLSVEHAGLVPDVVVAADPKLLLDGRDPQLEAGLIALGVDPAVARTATRAMIQPPP